MCALSLVPQSKRPKFFFSLVLKSYTGDVYFLACRAPAFLLVIERPDRTPLRRRRYRSLVPRPARHPVAE